MVSPVLIYLFLPYRGTQSTVPRQDCNFSVDEHVTKSMLDKSQFHSALRYVLTVYPDAEKTG